MKLIQKSVFFHSSLILLATILTMLVALPVKAGEYNALNGVKEVKAGFNVTFWAVPDVYDNEDVRSFPEPPQIAVVLHGEALKLIISDRMGISDSDKVAVNEFTDMVRQMKQEGLTLEICLYAAQVIGIDPFTKTPEVDHVGNGFV